MSMFTVINAVIEHECDIRIKESYINLTQQFADLSSPNMVKSSEQLLSRINSCLSVSNTRFEGMILLNSLLNHCPHEILNKNGHLWTQICVKNFQESKQIRNKQLSCQILTKMFESRDSMRDDSIVMQMIDSILSLNVNEILFDSVNCLIAFMSAFPVSCGTKTRSIEEYVLSNVDSADDESLDSLAKCMSISAHCGRSGHHAINHQNSWKEYMNRALKTLDSLLAIYESTGIAIVDLSNVYDNNCAAFFQSNSTANLLPRAIETLKRVEFTCEVINHLITDQFPSAIRLPIIPILSVVSKMCSINYNDIKNNHSLDVKIVGLLLPNIHECAISILESLIICAKSLTSTHSVLINKIILQTLEWTRDLECDHRTKPFLSLRKRVYLLIQLWCSTVGLNSGIGSTDIEKLIDEHLSDIKPAENILKLKCPQMKRNNGIDDLWSRKRIDSFLCTEAIKALRSIINTVGPVIDGVYHTNLHGHVIRLLLDIYRNRLSLSQPYDDAECRKELLNLLLSLQLNCNDSVSPPLEPSLVIFRDAQRLDESVSVKQFCSESTAVLTLLLHPKMNVFYSQNTENTEVSREDKVDDCETIETISDGESEVNNGQILCDKVIDLTEEEANDSPPLKKFKDVDVDVDEMLKDFIET